MRAEIIEWIGRSRFGGMSVSVQEQHEVLPHFFRKYEGDSRDWFPTAPTFVDAVWLSADVTDNYEVTYVTGVGSKVTLGATNTWDRVNDRTVMRKLPCPVLLEVGDSLTVTLESLSPHDAQVGARVMIQLRTVQITARGVNA